MFENTPGSNSGAVFREYMFSHFEGKLLTLIETLGFEAKREQAVKSIFSQELWYFWHESGVHPYGNPELAKFLQDWDKVAEASNPIPTVAN